MQGMARSSFGAHYEVERFGSHLPGRLVRYGEFWICYITKTPRIRLREEFGTFTMEHAGSRCSPGFCWIPTISVTVFVDDSFSAWWIDANQILHESSSHPTDHTNRIFVSFLFNKKIRLNKYLKKFKASFTVVFRKPTNPCGKFCI